MRLTEELDKELDFIYKLISFILLTRSYTTVFRKLIRVACATKMSDLIRVSLSRVQVVKSDLPLHCMFAYHMRVIDSHVIGNGVIDGILVGGSVLALYCGFAFLGAQFRYVVMERG